MRSFWSMDMVLPPKKMTVMSTMLSVVESTSFFECVVVLRMAIAKAMAPRRPAKMIINWICLVMTCSALRNWYEAKERENR